MLELGREQSRLHQPYEFAAQLSGFCTLQMWQALSQQGGVDRFADWCADLRVLSSGGQVLVGMQCGQLIRNMEWSGVCVQAVQYHAGIHGGHDVEQISRCHVLEPRQPESSTQHPGCAGQAICSHCSAKLSSREVCSVPGSCVSDYCTPHAIWSLFRRTVPRVCIA